jgi:hypothetical protein
MEDWNDDYKFNLLTVVMHQHNRGFHPPGTQYSIIPAFQYSTAQLKAQFRWEVKRKNNT